jgi:hypothetical protein
MVALSVAGGRAYHGETDEKGKAFHYEFLLTALTKGPGWDNYWIREPGQSWPS